MTTLNPLWEQTITSVLLGTKDEILMWLYFQAKNPDIPARRKDWMCEQAVQFSAVEHDDIEQMLKLVRSEIATASAKEWAAFNDGKAYELANASECPTCGTYPCSE